MYVEIFQLISRNSNTTCNNKITNVRMDISHQIIRFSVCGPLINRQVTCRECFILLRAAAYDGKCCPLVSMVLCAFVQLIILSLHQMNSGQVVKWRGYYISAQFLMLDNGVIKSDVTSFTSNEIFRVKRIFSVLPVRS